MPRPTEERHDPQGLVLLAHGARDPAWARPFEAIAERVRAGAPTLQVRLAFLELMEPALDEAGAELAGLGCRQVDVVPVFLGVGGHVRRDVPQQLARLAADHPGVDWRLHDAVGETAPVVAAIADVALAFARLATGAVDAAADPTDATQPRPSP